MGEVIDKSKLVKKFLNNLLRKKYIRIIAALEQVLNLNTTSFNDIVGRLKAYEEKIQDEDQQEDQGKLMYANIDSPTQHNSYGRGRGWGVRFGNRGRGRGNYNNQRDRRQGRDMSRVVCYWCDKTGHYVIDYPDRFLKLQETQAGETDSTHEAEELMMHEVVYLNEEKVMPHKFEESHATQV